MDLARILDQHVENRPDAPAVIGRSGTLTYAQLAAAADAQAEALREQGARPGDVVAACLPNDLDIVVSFHAAQRLGAIWAGIGDRLTPAEQQALHDLIRPRIVLAGPDCQVKGVIARPIRSLAIGRASGGSGGSSPRVSTFPPNAPWNLPPRPSPVPGLRAADPRAPAAIAFSSGTTGAPKTIVHTGEGLVLPARVLVETRGYGPDLVKGDSFAFTICNLQVLSTVLVALAGGTAVVMDRRDPEGIAGWISRHRVTLWNGAPAQLFDLAKRPGLDLSSLTEVWSGGGECPEYVREAFFKAHGVPVSPAYGLSEAPTVVSIDPPAAGGKPGGHKEGAAGRVLPHLDVAAYGDHGNRLPSGDQGELGIRAAADGPWAGQWKGPADNSNRHPALMTGDLGSVDADDWLTVTDRKKLLIVRGGANVSPAEVERVLHEHPVVDRAVVFGVPDERLGERVAALVVAAGGGLTADALRDFCAARLARYKIPEAWGRVPVLPVNAMNKVLRTDLPDALRAAEPL